MIYVTLFWNAGQDIEQEMDNLNLHAEEDGAAAAAAAEDQEEEQPEEEGVMVVPVVDVGAAAAALQQLQQDIVPVPPALLEPINNQVRKEGGLSICMAYRW